MPSNRIVYQNWIVELGRDPSVVRSDEREDCTARAVAEDRAEYIHRRVRAALTRLSENERELVEQVDFMGRTCSELAALTGRAEYRLDALHRRALRKLGRHLTPLVRELYGLDGTLETECPICRSNRRAEIDRVISRRDPRRSWRPVIRRLRDEFGLRITTPQTLIGHEKYHCIAPSGDDHERS